jgi:hypothetical protein
MCRHVYFDDDASGSTGDEAQVRCIAEDQLQPLAQSREPGPQAIGRVTQSGTGVGNADHTTFTRSCDVHVDPATVFAGVDPVSHGILDQRQ